jgi:hypothetical protein
MRVQASESTDPTATSASTIKQILFIIFKYFYS